MRARDAGASCLSVRLEGRAAWPQPTRPGPFRELLVQKAMRRISHLPSTAIWMSSPGFVERKTPRSDNVLRWIRERAAFRVGRTREDFYASQRDVKRVFRAGRKGMNASGIPPTTFRKKQRFERGAQAEHRVAAAAIPWRERARAARQHAVPGSLL